MVAIAVGTAQFGLDYGIVNNEGKVAPSEVAAILDLAQEHGVQWLDTAAAYGDAEAVIADMPITPDFRICTKIGASGATRLSDLDRELDASLARLRRSHADILLLHRPDALQSAPAAVLAWAASKRESGRIGAFGVSLYRAGEVELALQPGIEWVQIPISILSQEWIESGALARLRDHGVKVQVRSLLAQGLLTADPEALPPALEGLGASLSKVCEAAAENGVSPVELAFAFASRLQVELLVLGTQSRLQFAECLEALQRRVDLDWGRFAGKAELLDPRTWPAGLRIAK